jgi:hypothetical protein
LVRVFHQSGRNDVGYGFVNGDLMAVDIAPVMAWLSIGGYPHGGRSTLVTQSREPHTGPAWFPVNSG